MKISRSQLRRLIESAILNEDGYDQIMSGLGGKRDNGLLVPDGSNKDAILIHMAGTEYGRGKNTKAVKVLGMEKNAMEGIAKATGKDLSKKNYYIWRGLSEYWDSGMTELPASGRSGDPYLYMPSSIGSDGFIDKVRVVAGPQAKAIGRTISADALQGKPANLENMEKSYLVALGEQIAEFVKKAYDAGVNMSDGVEKFAARVASKYLGVEESTARKFVKGFIIGASAVTGIIGMAATTATVIPDKS
jgi:hypothetical protein